MPDWNDDDDEGRVGDSEPSDGDGYEWESDATEDETAEASPSDQPDKEADTHIIGKTLGISVGLGLGGFALGIIASLPLMFAVIVVFGLPFDETAAGENIPGFVANTVALQGIGMVGISVWYLSRYNLGRDFLRLRKPTLRHLGWIIGGTIILFISNILAGLAIQFFGLPTPEHGMVETLVENPELVLPGIILNLLLIGPAEELLYRGVIQTKLVNAAGTYKGILLASVIFAVVHFPAYGLGGWAAIISLILLGGILGLIYEYTDNLIVPIVAHGVYNSLLFLMIYAAILAGETDQLVAVVTI